VAPGTRGADQPQGHKVANYLALTPCQQLPAVFTQHTTPLKFSCSLIARGWETDPKSGKKAGEN